MSTTDTHSEPIDPYAQAHWYDDPSNDIDWDNYRAGWDHGRRAWSTSEAVDLTGHGEAYCDGFADGWAEGAQS